MKLKQKWYVLTPSEIYGICIALLIGLSIVVSVIGTNVENANRPIVILDVNTTRIYYAIDLQFTNDTTMSFYDLRYDEYVTLKNIAQKKKECRHDHES
jgi:hypothetical protein